MTTPTPKLQLILDNGKYEVRLEAHNVFYALRYNEKWRSLTGDKLVYLLAAELVELRKLQEAVTRLVPGDESAADRCRELAEDIYEQFNENRH